MSSVLLVDDAAPNRYLLETVLKGAGYEVTSARNGAEALALAKANPPDLVVTDILMPVMDGFDLCRRWKSNELLRRIPFVFYTANYTDPRDEEFALRLGADRFLVKPLKPEEFVATLRELLTAKGGGGAPDAKPAEALASLQRYDEAMARKMDAVRASEATYRCFFETCGDGLLILDEATGRIADANPALEGVIGRSCEELSGRTVRDGGLFRDAAAFDDALVRLRSQDHVRGAATLVHRDGRNTEAEFVASAYEGDGTRLVQFVFRPKHEAR